GAVEVERDERTLPAHRPAIRPPTACAEHGPTVVGLEDIRHAQERDGAVTLEDAGAGEPLVEDRLRLLDGGRLEQLHAPRHMLVGHHDSLLRLRAGARPTRRLPRHASARTLALVGPGARPRNHTGDDGA